MRRWLFDICAAVSVLLMLAAGGFWIRGLWVHDMPEGCYVWYPEPHLRHARFFSIRSSNGRFELSVVRNDFNLKYPAGIVSTGDQPGWVEDFLRSNPPGFSGQYHSRPIPPNHSYATVGDGNFGFGFRHIDQVTQARHDEYWTLSVPAWFVLLLSGILPALWLRRRLQLSDRRRKNLCLTCGYDLTGNVSGVCPECGTVIRERSAIHL